MSDDSDNMAGRHRRVCKTFGDEVRAIGNHWQAPSPCGDWDARGVLEHVIGFHDVLLLRPLGAKPNARRTIRWAAGRKRLAHSTSSSTSQVSLTASSMFLRSGTIHRARLTPVESSRL